MEDKKKKRREARAQLEAELDAIDRITPTILKWVSRTLPKGEYHGGSGKAVLAAAIRSYHGLEGPDDAVIISHFKTLGKSPLPKKSPKKTGDIASVITEKTDPWVGNPTPADQPPWLDTTS